MPWQRAGIQPVMQAITQPVPNLSRPLTTIFPLLQERQVQQDQFQAREEQLLADIETHSSARVAAERKASDADERAADAVRAAERAQAASDLKRECSQKLKEEVIENDKLTLATLNRIKMLEADLELSRRELERTRPDEGVRAREMAALKEQAAENEQMRAALRHREEASLRLSERMQAMAERIDYYEQATKQKQIDGACAEAANRSLQERGQLGPVGSPPPAGGYKSGASRGFQESPARRDSLFDRISASSFGLSRQSILGLDL
jgi:chromosome segregation ATPase